MRISSERGLPGLGPDQPNEYFVQGRVGLVEATQSYAARKTRLQNGLRIGVLAEFEFPTMRLVVAVVRYEWRCRCAVWRGKHGGIPLRDGNLMVVGRRQIEGEHFRKVA